MSDGDGGQKLLYNPHIFLVVDDANCRPGGSCTGGIETAELLGYMKGAAKEKGVKGIRVNRSTCQGFCEYGPVMVFYPEGIAYTFRTREDIDEIIDTHLVGHQRVERLMVNSPAPQQKRATA